jgi:5-methylcytosine-specific restriction endonuclease McrA
VTLIKDKNGLLYTITKDRQGTQRRKYQLLCLKCQVPVYIQKSKLSIQKYCNACVKTIPVSNVVKNKISKTLQQKYKTDDAFKAKVLAARNVKKGEEHWNWKGGVTSLTQRTRTSEESHAWKLAVLHRDGYSCRMCGSKENLQAHHINSWADFPEDRFILENGLTMCKPCHDTYHQYEREIRRNQN